MDRLVSDLQARCKDPRLFVKELIHHGCLTPFQANLLLQGRATDLLVGPYVLLERLGEGGMGQVYKARHRQQGHLVALKVVRKERLANSKALRRFSREVKLVTQLKHPNIVRAHEAGHDGNHHYLAMEYLDGVDLKRFIQESGPAPVDDACQYIRQAAQGLQYAHERGLTHRDIKPSNLLLLRPNTSAATVKLLDLGLARVGGLVDSEKTLTQDGAFLGSPQYVAPEQALHAGGADARSDLYSLGGAFYYLLTGRPPFHGDSLAEILLKHQLEVPKPVEEFRPELSPRLAAVIRKLLAKRPEERYQSAGEFLAALASVEGTSQSPTAPAKKMRPIEPASTSPRQDGSAVAVAASLFSRRWVLIAGAAGAGALMLVILAAYAIGHAAPRSKNSAAVTALRIASNPTGPRNDRTDHRPPPPSAPGQQPRPVDESWVQSVAQMTPEQQVDVVVKKLRELNPEFDGRIERTIEKSQVVSLSLCSDRVTNLAPLRALKNLQVLSCAGSTEGPRALADLTPLHGMPLVQLNCGFSQVSDLTPLKGMPLTKLNCGVSKVSNLSPLHGMPLNELVCWQTSVHDLSPLRGMHLTVLNLEQTRVSDLAPLVGVPLQDLRINHSPIRDLGPLRGMPLKRLNFYNTPVEDLSPLKGMPLTELNCSLTRVRDLSPLLNSPLKDLVCDFQPVRDAGALRSLKTLQTINGQPAHSLLK
jgi:serine/threonine protein kinase